jgi:modification target Cys-rich repeat protein
MSKRFLGPALVFTALVPATLQGCGDNPLCCTEFKAGATISAEIGGGAQAQVAVQAVADFAGIANAAITDLASACRSMSEDLDADKAKRDAIEAEANAAKPDDAQKIRMEKYCALAIETIASVKASAQATITIVAQPPKCEISASAKANCQAKCDVSGKCEASAELKCEGGKLEVSCEGSCAAEVQGGSIQCEGSCEATCEGECTATTGGVECAGKCEGTCKGAAQGGTGEGITATGECKGTCEGTCKATAPSAKCNGSCKGGCTGTCKATAPGAKVKCDGKCEGKAEPLKCDGQLKGGCNVDAKCDANCDASVQAKAECTPPAIVVDIQAGAGADLEAIGKLKATFEANMGVIFAFKSRLEGMAKLTGTITGSASAIGEIKAACIPEVAVVAGKAVADVSASAQVTAQLVSSATQ